MMKYFEWAKQLPEDERARLLRVYDEIRRQYAARPETDVIRGMISTWLTEPKKQREAREESIERAHKWNAISGLILHWCKHHDTTKSLRTLINEHEQRYKSAPEYMGKVDSGELQAFVFDRDYTDDKSEFWYSHISSCYSILNDQYLFFNNTGLYDVNTDMSLIEAFEYARGKVQEFEHKIKRIYEYDFETPLRTMEFASSIIKHIEDPSFGYFPELADLRAYLLPDKVTSVQAEQTTEPEQESTSGLSYRGLAYYHICEGVKITGRSEAKKLFDKSQFGNGSTSENRGQLLLTQYRKLVKDRDKLTGRELVAFYKMTEQLEEMNILSTDGLNRLEADKSRAISRIASGLDKDQ